MKADKTRYKQTEKETQKRLDKDEQASSEEIDKYSSLYNNNEFFKKNFILNKTSKNKENILLYKYISNNNNRKAFLKKNGKKNSLIPKLKAIILGRKMIYILFVNLIYQIELKNNNNYNENFLLKAYEITLKVNSTGEHTILSEYGYNNNEFPCPNKIYINNTEIENLSSCYKINVNIFDSIIKLE